MKIKLLLVFIILQLFAFEAFASKRVLILYSTGGHATAAKSIEQMLSETPGEFEVIRHDFADDLTGYSRWFYKKGYDLVSRYASWINDIGLNMSWGEANRKSALTSDRRNADFNQPDRIMNYIESVHPDIIITTHFSMAETLATLRARGRDLNMPIAWTHLDMIDNIYFRQIGDQLDMSFVPTQEMAESWGRVMAPAKVEAVGIPIMPQLLTSKAASDVPAAKLAAGMNPSGKMVLLLGGSMGALSYKPIINEIARASNEPVEIVAVCGRNKPAAEGLRKWAHGSGFNKNVKLTVTEFIDQGQLKTYQNAADVIISKPGGLTTFELLMSERPVIMAEGLSTQERSNAEFIRDQGAALYFAKPKGIGAAVAELIKTDSQTRSSLVAHQKSLGQIFHLSKIVEWARHPAVLQAQKPETTVWQKQKDKDDEWARHARLCNSILGL